MLKKSWSVITTIGLSALIVVALFVMLGAMPGLANWYYNDIRHGAAGDGKPLLIAFYLCVPAAFFVIYNLIRLMINIYKGEVFILRNITYLRCLAWGCAAASVVTFVAGCFYMPLLIVSFAALFICLIIRVIRHIMSAAVEIKNENELTI